MAGRSSTRTAGRKSRSTAPRGQAQKSRRPGKVGMLGTLLAAAGAAASSPAGRRALAGAKDRATAARARRSAPDATANAGEGI